LSTPRSSQLTIEGDAAGHDVLTHYVKKLSLLMESG